MNLIPTCKLSLELTKVLTDIEIAGLKVNKTDQKTILIAKLMHTRFNPKLTTRSLAIHLKKELIKIDSSLANRGDEKEKHWHERIYQRAFKALQRYDL